MWSLFRIRVEGSGRFRRTVGRSQSGRNRGTELFYRDASGNLVAVGVNADLMFLGRAVDGAFFRPRDTHPSDSTPQYAVAPDDKRFLMIRPLETKTADNIIVVENWFEELKTAASGSGRGLRHR